MKKNLILTTVAILLPCLFVSCDTDESSETPTSNPLVGTLWMDQTETAPTYFEFTGENAVSSWGGYYQTGSGTYTIQGSKVLFSLERTTSNNKRTLIVTEGIFSTNTMTVTYYEDFIDNSNVLQHTGPFSKRLYKQ